jgi:hypothetical protein
MKIVHRISLNATIELKREFLAAGINLRERPNLPEGFAWFDIEESDVRWPMVAELIHKHRAGDLARTEFTCEEVEKAEALGLAATWHRGYPQPDRDFAYRSVTYDLREFCEVCGVGRRQKAPFRIRGGEPSWRRGKIFQLNWVFDEFFVERGLWEAVIAPLGVDARPVLDASSKTELQTVVQLDIASRASALLSGYPKERCQKCGRDKYVPITRGAYPYIAIGSTGSHAVKTLDYFGSGHSAFQEVIISRDLGVALRRAGVKGVKFIPVSAAS